MAGFNFLSGMPQQFGQMQMPYQQMYQSQLPAWLNPSAQLQQQMSLMPGEQGGIPTYAQNPLSNQGANGFSLGDRLQRFKSSMGEQNMNMGLAGLQMMLGGWGSHS